MVAHCWDPKLAELQPVQPTEPDYASTLARFREAKPIGPPCLQILAVGFLKPTTPMREVQLPGDWE